MWPKKLRLLFAALCLYFFSAPAFSQDAGYIKGELNTLLSNMQRLKELSQSLESKRLETERQLSLLQAEMQISQDSLQLTAQELKQLESSYQAQAERLATLESLQKTAAESYAALYARYQSSLKAGKTKNIIIAILSIVAAGAITAHFLR